MSLMWFLKRLGGPTGAGLFAYLTSRNQNKSRIELEKARQVAATDLIDHLPDGAVFRESTADGWREIWMPPLQAPPLFALPADSGEFTQDASTLGELLAQNPKALNQGNGASVSGGLPATRTGVSDCSPTPSPASPTSAPTGTAASPRRAANASSSPNSNACPARKSPSTTPPDTTSL